MAYPKLTPIVATDSTEPRYFGDRFADVVNVKDFGAKGDGTTDDTEAFEAAVAATNNSGTHGVFVPKGSYLISSQISQRGLWVISPNATILGQSGVPSVSPILQDTSRLTGSVIHLNGKINRVGDPTICIGTSDHWLSKNWKYASEIMPKINVSNDGGLPAAYFSTYVGDGNPSGFSVGITAVSDDHENQNMAWGFYCEGIRAALDENQQRPGALFNCEMDMINLGDTGPLSPFGGQGSDWTCGLWFACGGGTSAPFGGNSSGQDPANVHDCSAVMGVTPNPNSYMRGIVFRGDSIHTNGSQGSTINEAVSMPPDQGFAWYKDVNAPIAVLGAYRFERRIYVDNQATAVRDKTYKYGVNNQTTSGTTFYAHDFYASATNNEQDSFLCGRIACFQRAEWDATSNLARFAIELSAQNLNTNDFTGVAVNYGTDKSFSPQTDGNITCGNNFFRWSTVYASSGTINTSDSRYKENIEAPSEALLRAWDNVGFKVFQFKDSIAEKGVESARLHIGIVAQDVKKAFDSEGIDANRYGLFCYDEWEDMYTFDEVIDKPAVKDKNGDIVEPEQKHTEKVKVKEAGNIYGIRYEEALALECACLRRRIEKLEQLVNS